MYLCQVIQYYIMICILLKIYFWKYKNSENYRSDEAISLKIKITHSISINLPISQNLALWSVSWENRDRGYRDGCVRGPKQHPPAGQNRYCYKLQALKLFLCAFNNFLSSDHDNHESFLCPTIDLGIICTHFVGLFLGEAQLCLWP